MRLGTPTWVSERRNCVLGLVCISGLLSLTLSIIYTNKPHSCKLAFAVNEEIFVDPVFVPAALVQGRREVLREQAAMAEIVNHLELSYTIKRYGELELPGTTPVQSGELAPIVLLPDVEQLKLWLGQVPPYEVAPPLYDTTYDDKNDIPFGTPGIKGGESAVLQHEPLGTKSGFKASKPWGVPEEDWNVYVRVEQACRLTQSLAYIRMIKSESKKLLVGSIRTWPSTDRVWGYSILDEPRTARQQPEQGWMFAIAEANSMPRTANLLKNVRASSTTNHVETNLIEPRWPETLVPFIMPRPYKENENEEGTEAIVISDRMLDAANGVLMVRAAATWSSEFPDFVIDDDPANHARVLAVFIDHRVSDERLIEIVKELCKPNDKKNSSIGKVGQINRDDKSLHGKDAHADVLKCVHAIRAGECDSELDLASEQ